MPVAQQDSAKRGTDIHPLKSGCQVSPPPDGESGQIEVGVLRNQPGWYTNAAVATAEIHAL
jgi:hypothetical protein